LSVYDIGQRKKFKKLGSIRVWKSCGRVFTVEAIRKIIKPTINQVEFHPYLPNAALVE
jgi:hypothetical protein